MSDKELVLRNLEVFGVSDGRPTAYVFARPEMVEEDVEVEEDVWKAWTSNPENLL